MRDKVKIGAALAVFLVLVTFPFWYAQVAPGGPPLPEREPPTDGSHCIEKDMVALHMGLLDRWRNEVVREGVTERYESKSYPGEYCDRSLTTTCLKCHTMEVERDGKRSCTQCHNYAKVQPRCMDCHVEPVESKEN